MTDAELYELEKLITKEYAKAKVELGAQADEYFEHYRERWKKEYEAYKKSVYSDSEWKQWQYNQIGRGNHWKELRDQMSSRLTETKIIASQYANDALPRAYANASNYEATLARASAIEQGALGIRFDLVDEYTVRNLMMHNGNNIEFRTLSVNPVRDYKWNSQRIQSALLQGILQGDSISDFTNRFMLVMENNRKSAIRNARTAVTSARSAGKQSRWNDLARQGCEMTKIWVDTHDGMPPEREAHWLAHMQEVPYDEPFVVGGEEMMYPCDASASPANVYNCRCTMKLGKIKFHSTLSDDMRRRANIRMD